MILDAEYIKEQAHKPCFWSEEYGFDVVAFTQAMEQNYANRVGSKINQLKKENKELRALCDQLGEALELGWSPFPKKDLDARTLGLEALAAWREMKK